MQNGERERWAAVLGAVECGLGSTSKSGPLNALRRIAEIAREARSEPAAPGSPVRVGIEKPFEKVRQAASAVPVGGDGLEELLTSDVAIEALSEATRTAPHPWDPDDRARLWSALAYVAARLSSMTKGGGGQ